MTTAPPFLPTRAAILLGLLTLACFGGPFALVAILHGGDQSGWPPDRPIEWAALFGVVGLVLALLVAAIAHAMTLQRRT
jgi:predicted PurR-regulated permease PerM